MWDKSTEESAFRHRVFVYGSLKRNRLHHDQLAAALFDCYASVKGYFLVLYEDAYPALVRCESGEELSVEGEVFRVNDALLLDLDRFEECPRLYQRSAVVLDDGSEAWAYVIEARKAQHYRRIGSTW